MADQKEWGTVNYDEWSYANLLNLKEQLEDSIRRGQPLRSVLLAVNKEIAERRFALVGVLGGNIVKEYGRWKSRARCEEQAKRMGLPVGTPFAFAKQRFETVVRGTVLLLPRFEPEDEERTTLSGATRSNR